MPRVMGCKKDALRSSGFAHRKEQRLLLTAKKRKLSEFAERNENLHMLRVYLVGSISDSDLQN